MASCLSTTYQRHSSSDAIEDIARQTVTTHLSISEHVRDVISRCGQCMHALQILPAESRQADIRRTRLVGIHHCCPADRYRIGGLLRRGVQAGHYYGPTAPHRQ